jgi:hypothetical protein
LNFNHIGAGIGAETGLVYWQDIAVRMKRKYYQRPTLSRFFTSQVNEIARAVYYLQDRVRLLSKACTSVNSLLAFPVEVRISRFLP